MGLPRYMGVISDLHANFEALKVCVNWLEAQRVERIVCLGDIVGYNANPREVTYLAWNRCELSLKGNHERYVLGEPAPGVKEEKLEVIDWTRQQLDATYLDWLRLLPDYHVYEETLLLVHGSPRDPDEYIVRRNTIDGCLDYIREHYDRLPLCLFGHSHLPALITDGYIETDFSSTRTIQLERGRQYLINPGSVGQPRDGHPKASFGLLDTVRWTFTWVRLDYDFTQTAQRIRQAGLDPTLATRLSKGR